MTIASDTEVRWSHGNLPPKGVEDQIALVDHFIQASLLLLLIIGTPITFNQVREKVCNHNQIKVSEALHGTLELVRPDSFHRKSQAATHHGVKNPQDM